VTDVASEAGEMLWLLGQPSLEDYLAFVRTRVVGGDRLARSIPIADWRAANDHYYDLRATEAGAADGHAPAALSAQMAPMADALRTDPHFIEACSTFPGEIMMAELDRLVVYQPHISVDYAEQRAAELAPHKDDAGAIFRHCLPRERASPPVRIQRLAGDRYRFTSASTDLRPHAATLLRPNQVSGAEQTGPIAGIIGLIVGYGTNFLSAIAFNGRVLLHNGYHRAYTLRAAGITHAPMLIRSVATREELYVAAVDRVADDLDHYFASPRPPMLKDYFDPALAKRHLAYPSQTSVEVEFKMRRVTAGVRSG
jgi:hypothetical protein